MISVELNTAIKAKFTTLGTPYSTIKFIPLSGYSTSSAPFIIYNQFDGTQSEEQFFLRIANVTYTIYDNDISRLKDVAYQMDKFLNVSDRMSEINSLLSTPYYDSSPMRYRITTVRRVSGGLNPPPAEREGFAFYLLNYRVVYLDNLFDLP